MRWHWGAAVVSDFDKRWLWGAAAVDKKSLNIGWRGQPRPQWIKVTSPKKHETLGVPPNSVLFDRTVPPNSPHLYFMHVWGILFHKHYINFDDL